MHLPTIKGERPSLYEEHAQKISWGEEGTLEMAEEN